MTRQTRTIIPETIEGVAALFTARKWDKAAIVWAYVDANGRGKRGGIRRRTKEYTPDSFADLGLFGLSSNQTVLHYWQAWQDAIDSGDAQPVAPGDEIPTVDLPWVGGADTRHRYVPLADREELESKAREADELRKREAKRKAELARRTAEREKKRKAEKQENKRAVAKVPATLPSVARNGRGDAPKPAVDALELRLAKAEEKAALVPLLEKRLEEARAEADELKAESVVSPGGPLTAAPFVDGFLRFPADNWEALIQGRKVLREVFDEVTDYYDEAQQELLAVEDA
jgi:hypothetical protein